MGPHPGSPGMQRPMDNPGLGPMHPSMRPGMLQQHQQQQQQMRMQQLQVGGGVFPGNPMDPDMVGMPQMPGQTSGPPGMYGGPPGSGQKPPGGMPGGPLGPPPDASQPLPPSMGGTAGNFKSSPFMAAGSSMNDPNYRQQFHNFQQQLYATGTRGSGPPHPNMHGQQPNSHSHQQFFMPK